VILVVDDDLDVLGALRRVLRALGEPLLVVSSPHQALAALDQQPIKVILSDVDMPEMNGHELLRHCRERHPTVVRLLISGKGSLESALTAINQTQVFRFVTKPFEASALRQAVREALDHHAERARSSEADAAAEQRRAMFEQLEQECPGITAVSRDPDGAYLLEADRCAAGEQLFATLGLFVARH
jgi:two-component system, probable response regulator PhcQ